MATKYRKKSENAAKAFENISYVPAVTKVKFKLDKTFLNMLIGYLFCKSKTITRYNLQCLKKLIEAIDIDFYMNNEEIYARLIFIKAVLDAKLTKGLEKREVIINEARVDNDDITMQIIDGIDDMSDKISFNEIKAINKFIADRLKYAYFVFYKEIISNLFLRVDQGAFDTLEECSTVMKNVLTSCLNEIRKTESATSTSVFSLRDDIFPAVVEHIVTKFTDPSICLRTGIKYLNNILSPGFFPGRVYLFLGVTGSYKSSILIQCARWIKLYNKVTPRRKDPSAIPTVLLITTENSVDEEVVRLYNMSVGDDEQLSKYTPDEVINKLRTEGKMVLKNGNDIDIYIKYYANMEIDTSDLYGIIEDIEDDNREVITLIIDYIARIRPAEKAMEERIQLKNVSNELKTLSIHFDIPVITANQINRAGNTTIDAAAEGGKQDLARFLGRGNIALSWQLLENVDWCAILNVELDNATNLYYLTFKRIKIRYKDLANISYFNHPFEQGSKLRLLDDVLLDKPLSVELIGSNLTGANTGGSRKGNFNAKKRKEVDDVDDLNSLFGDPVK